MGEVYKELGEVKAELEKLKEDCRVKTELSESLRRAHSDQQTKCQEAKLKIEKQEKELNVKSDEIVELRQLCEEVKLKLHETEVSLKQVTSMNEKLRIDSGEKVQRLEGENRKLMLDFEEVMTKNGDLDRKLHTCSEEIKSLKGCLSESQRKFSEAEEKLQVGKELRQKEDVIMKLEEQSMSVQDQLKWKKEQFQHLEEAHRRLQDQFQLNKKERESEKSAMLGEMTMLQSKLDSNIRVTESLESRLKMCNQALSHEESRRKLLEVQLSESKQCFENVLAEYEEAKEKIENLITKRDEDIADLRNSLGVKEAVFKDMEYKVTYLEQENKELLGTVKELQKAQINRRKVDPSVTKLRNKLKDLEQTHNTCLQTLEEKEAEWNSKMQKLIDDVKCYESDVNGKNEQMYRLKTQLDHCHSALEISGEETSILFTVLKSELSDVYSKLFNLEAQTDAFNEENAEGCLEKAHAEVASLTQKLKSLELLEKRGKILEDALEEHKRMLEESSHSQLCLKEEVTELEVAFREVTTALEKSNNRMTEKIKEASHAEAELLLWKSKAESFRTCLEQSQEVCKKLETSILEQVEIEKSLREENEISQCNLKEQEQKIIDLEQNIASLNQILKQKDAVTEETKLEVAKSVEKEGRFLRLLEERDTMVGSLQKELKAAEFAKVEVHNQFEHEKEKLCRIIKENNVVVEKLGKEIEVLKQEFATSESSRIEAEIRFKHEKEEMSRVISEKDESVSSLRDFAFTLERDVNGVYRDILHKDVENLVHMLSLQEALENAEFNISNSTQLVIELEASLHATKQKMEEKTYEFEDGKARLYERVKELEDKNEAATHNITSLSFERDSLLIYIENVCERFSDVCRQDAELDGMLAKMLQSPDAVISGKVSSPGQKNVRKDVEPRIERSPLHVRNQ